VGLRGDGEVEGGMTGRRDLPTGSYNIRSRHGRLQDDRGTEVRRKKCQERKLQGG
jgi:hypothetical protein